MKAEVLGKFFVASMMAAAILIFAATPAKTATYYVSQSTGDDSSNGQAAKPDGSAGPWKTLARASTSNYVAGDRILLKCGDTWNEELHPKGSGAADNPITISSYGEGKKPLIDRQDYKKEGVDRRIKNFKEFTHLPAQKELRNQFWK